MRQRAILSLGLAIILMLGFPAFASVQSEGKEAAGMEDQLRLFLNGTEVAVLWEENESVAALAELAAAGPLTVQMSIYGGFEQVGPLGAELPRNDSQTTTQPGDIVLYSGDRIVIFFGSNSWAYTRLGRIVDQTAEELAELLSKGDVSIVLSCGE